MATLPALSPGEDIAELLDLDQQFGDKTTEALEHYLDGPAKSRYLEQVTATLAELRQQRQMSDATFTWLEAERYYLVWRFALYMGQMTTDKKGRQRPFRSFNEWATTLEGRTAWPVSLRIAYEFRRRFSIDPRLTPERWEKLFNTAIQKIEVLNDFVTWETLDELLTLASGVGQSEPALTLYELRELREAMKTKQMTLASALEEARNRTAPQVAYGWSSWPDVLATARRLLRDPEAYVTITTTRKAGGKIVEIVIKED
jgi:hypothetical protein